MSKTPKPIRFARITESGPPVPRPDRLRRDDMIRRVAGSTGDQIHPLRLPDGSAGERAMAELTAGPVLAAEDRQAGWQCLILWPQSGVCSTAGGPVWKRGARRDLPGV